MKTIRSKYLYQAFAIIVCTSLSPVNTVHAATSVICSNKTTGIIQIRERKCKKSENLLKALSQLVGSTGSTGATGPQGPAGPQGESGPQGVQGPQGIPGTNGVAVAYARVGANGILDPGTPPQNKNIEQSNVQHDGTTGSGVYCFGGLSFTPTSAMVTLDSAGTLTSSNQIVSVAVQRGLNLGSCDASHQQVRVSITQVDQTNAPALTDHGFIIWFQD